MANSVIKICVPQEVKVRQFEVDKTELSSLLREKKKKANISNKVISEKLNKPLTLVEHWFRSDGYFATPDEDSWFMLKELLDIHTDKFDKAITSFVYKRGSFEQSERCYLDIGICPTLTTLCNSDKTIITDGLFVENKVEVLGRLMPNSGKIHQNQEVYNTFGERSMCVLKATDYKNPPKILVGYKTENKDKDAIKIRKDCLEMTDKIEPTVKVNEDSDKKPRYRIRRLTPRECWRLMDFTDEDFEKAKWYSKEEAAALLVKYPNHKGKRQFTEEGRIERMSDLQLYKQAGNSICVGVLYYIYKELYKAMPYLFDDLKVSSYFSGIGAFESALDRLYDDITSEENKTPVCTDMPTGGEGTYHI